MDNQDVQKAIAAVKANPFAFTGPLLPHGWASMHTGDTSFEASCTDVGGRDAIIAAVNAATLLIAEVECLQKRLAAARESIDLGWPAPAHSFYCGYWRGPDGYDSRLCDCDVEQRKNDRAHARRALGLEEGE